MVWAGVSTRGKMKLVFIDRTVKINAGYYQAEILKKHVHPTARKLFGRQRLWLQQDWTLAHWARSILAYCQRLFPHRFCSKEMWPSASSDPNPLDYAIWALLMQLLGRGRFQSLKQLKAALRWAWQRITTKQLQNIVGQFRKRLMACIVAKGGNCEHLLR